LIEGDIKIKPPIIYEMTVTDSIRWTREYACKLQSKQGIIRDKQQNIYKTYITYRNDWKMKTMKTKQLVLMPWYKMHMLDIKHLLRISCKTNIGCFHKHFAFRKHYLIEVLNNCTYTSIFFCECYTSISVVPG
jgi:hypothetical protein